MRRTDVEPRLSADYLGQTVVIGETWNFRGPLPPGVLRWWWRRQMPALEDPWILFVRADVATLGEAGASETAP
jgi:hypothetical protein